VSSVIWIRSGYRKGRGKMKLLNEEGKGRKWKVLVEVVLC
jgi:hypothetical protein